MKNYSSNRAQKGKTAYRTPSMFRANADFTSVKSSIRDFARKQNRDKAMYYAKMKGGSGQDRKSQTHNFKANKF